MKAIIYKIIAILIFGIITTGFSIKPFTKQTIILQSADIHIASATLLQSADIITMRLKSFGAGRFEVKSFPDKQQIQVILKNDQDMKVIENLITRKGILEFYETYGYHEFFRLLNGDSSMINLFHAQASRNSAAVIGCTSSAEMNRINEYINTSGLNEKCRFAWNDLFDDSEVCLYALRTENENRIPLTGADIHSFEVKPATKWQKDSIGFKFKNAAIQTWADATKRNLHKAIAILMDNKVIYAPVVTSEIIGGDCEITGDFTQTQVRFIAAIGGSGPLPADFMVVK